jgi:hypothetical protein
LEFGNEVYGFSLLLILAAFKGTAVEELLAEFGAWAE